MTNFHLPAAPKEGRSPAQHRLRSLLSVVAAVAGGLAVVALALALVGSVTPAAASGLWIGMTILFAIWLTGIWWRTDSPDVRGPQRERERRGF